MISCESEFLAEKEFQDRIESNIDIKNSILNILELDEKCVFSREVEFINGITSDFIISDDKNYIKAIIECKRADIGVTEYVRGVGQLFQYEYFQDEKISPKKFRHLIYDERINNNILVIPSTFIKNTTLNIGRFRYPKNSMIFEVHIANNRVRQITSEELERLKQAENDKLVTLSQYYIRDNRIFECYILFQLLGILNQLNIAKNRRSLEDEVLRKINVINNRNWRNAFITLSSLGFIGTNSQIYKNELSQLKNDIYNFINLIYKDYLYPFIDLLMEILKELSDENSEITISNKELADIIRNKYKGKNILFLTDSNERYISSWLNILRDDLGCIDFKPRTSLRKIRFIPKELTDVERINKIKENTKAKEYVENFEKIKTDLIKGVL